MWRLPTPRTSTGSSAPRTAPIAVSRTDKVRIFDPETFQKKRAWATDYRKYHDLWVPDNKLTAMWVNIKQAKPAAPSGDS